MTTFVLAATRTARPEQVVADPKAMLDAGLLTAYTLRANGTTRHLTLCPVGSTARDTAEWVSERLGDGLTLKAVARELHASVPTVRRIIMALELTEEIEAGEWDDVWAATQGYPVPVDPEIEDRVEVLMQAFTDDVRGDQYAQPEPEMITVLF